MVGIHHNKKQMMETVGILWKPVPLKRYLPLPLPLLKQVMLMAVVVQKHGLVCCSKFLASHLYACIINIFVNRSKAEPEPVKKPVTNNLHDASEKELPPLQKVDDAWLSAPTPTNDNLNQWDQPIQETAKSSLSPPSPPPATTSNSSTTATTTTKTQPQIKKTLDDDIPIDFNSLSLKEKENVPEV